MEQAKWDENQNIQEVSELEQKRELLLLKLLTTHFLAFRKLKCIPKKDGIKS